MSLRQLNKKLLTSIAEKLELEQEGTKSVLEERIGEYLDNHPELEEDEEFAKYVLFRKKSSPKKVSPPSPEGKILKQTESKLTSTPSKLFQISRRFRGADSSPSKETQVDEEEADEDEDEDEDEDDEDEDDEDEDVELLEGGEDKELLEDEDEVDPEYTPSKFEFVGKIQDWFIEKYESTASFAEETSQDLTSSVFKQSNELRKTLSSADSVNILTSSVEFTLLMKEQISTVQLRQASFLDQKILSKYSKIIDPKWSIPDFSVLLDAKVLLFVLFWFLLSVVIPLIGSYYINFIVKKSKKTRFDPFVFNIVKLILAYLFLSGNVSFNDVKNSTEVWAEEHGLKDASFCHHLGAFAFRNSITLRLILGNLPFIDGAIGGLVALYVAAI